MDYVELIQQEYEWSELPWKKFEKVLYKLQKRIYQASLRGDVLNVRRLQKLLIKSRSAKLISVRRVTQDNQGSKTAGVDGVKNLTPKQRFKLVDKISLGSKVSPVRRVWIPKPGKDEKRPLGIPTMEDRAVQCLAKMALEPEWEAKFEPNSYGFRPGRSCQDAVEAIFLSIRYKPKYVLDADISHCFDKIDEIISEWLNDMGLELKPSKTRISHTMHNVGIEKAGFDFLGFNITQVKVGKHNSGKYCGKLLGYKTIIKPMQIPKLPDT